MFAGIPQLAVSLALCGAQEFPANQLFGTM
jgi:hypothetical protein